MSKETLKNLIELVPENDIDILYQIIIKFIPEVEPEPDEIAAIMEEKTGKRTELYLMKPSTGIRNNDNQKGRMIHKPPNSCKLTENAV
jgi:hypothetical protein